MYTSYVITFKHTPCVAVVTLLIEYGFVEKMCVPCRKFKCKLRKIVLHRFCESLIYFYFSSLYTFCFSNDTFVVDKILLTKAFLYDNEIEECFR